VAERTGSRGGNVPREEYEKGAATRQDAALIGFRDSLPAIKMTPITQKKATAAVTSVSEPAAARSEIPFKKRFDAVKEFRGPMLYRGAVFLMLAEFDRVTMTTTVRLVATIPGSSERPNDLESYRETTSNR
jgi:hypothetical protein